MRRQRGPADFIRRRPIVARRLPALIGLISVCLISCARDPGPPNIIFIFSDDHAVQAISAYGGRLAAHAPTPNIDRIGREGMRFDRCTVTNSICAPSRAVILTGKFGHLNGIMTNRDRFDGGQQTFPKLLRQANYQTALVGKWHLKSEPTGFDFWEVLPGQGHYYNPEFRTPEGQGPVAGYVTEIITDKALAWLRQGRDKTKPFLLMLHHKAPHREWEPGPGQLGLFSDVVFPEPDNLFDDYSGRGTAAHSQDMTIARTMRLGADLKIWRDEAGGARRRTYDRMDAAQKRAWDATYDPIVAEFNRTMRTGDELVRWKYQRYLQDYLGCVRSVDDNVGRILDYLDESGLARNTVVVYNSDQGFYLGEHGWFDKRFMYEESFRTPLLVRWPQAVDAGQVSDELVSNLDLAQTFLDLAGVPAPADMQGRSLKPILLGATPDDWRSSLYYHYSEYPAVHSVHKHEGVATKRYKLIHFYEIDEWELYDLERDPREMNSVHADPAYQEIRKRLQENLQALKMQYRVPNQVPGS